MYRRYRRGFRERPGTARFSPADRRRALEQAGETPIVGQRIPQRALRVGRIAAQELRQAADGRIRSARLFRMGCEQRAQRARLIVIQDAATRRPLAALGDRHDHT